MAKPFRVDVVSPEATIWSGEATFVAARTPEGEIGILADHEPTLAALVTSAVEVEGVDGTRTSIGVHGGFLQVLRNQVTLLTDRAQITQGTKEQAAEVAASLAAQGEG
jgi:F-type H+-transporting ATPase subunit epsilon